MKDTLNFWISSGLKDLIGRKQITDEYIAIYELVKNSFDAHAKNVQIIFENLKEENSRIIIIDDGKGMDIKDIKDKWLGVAYSAKKEGTEDDTYKDYRNKIKQNVAFAGAKGVGRFSCDRLGRKLNMITVKDAINSKIENIIVDWENFESDSKKEFVEINIEHQILESNRYNINNGTILEISGIRDKETWNRQGLQKLKHSLEKLINPNQKKDTFKIEIIAKEEIEADKNEKLERDKINGFIENRLFETLNVKTTHIETKILKDKIITILVDRGNLIYQIEENNPYEIDNITIFLFLLNRKAKYNFKKLVGVDSVAYGSVFMYKNGYRIYPFGEEGEDIFGINKRKVQGYNRFLGTRELIGRIEIFDSLNKFEETTSRDGGLIKNKNYSELSNFFLEKALRRLERYVVEVIRWGDPITEKIDGIKTGKTLPEITFEDIKIKIIEDAKHKDNKLNFNITLQEVINKEIIGFIYWLAIHTSEIIEVEYDRDFFQIIDERQRKSTSKIFNKVEKQISKYNDPNLLKEVKKLKKDFKQIREAKKEAEKETDFVKETKKEIEKKLESQIKQTLFAREVVGIDAKEFLGLQHQVRRASNIIAGFTDRLIYSINNNEPKEELLNYISKIDLKNKEISTLAEFVTKANFDTRTAKITKDIVAFVNEYIENVYKNYEHIRTEGTSIKPEVEYTNTSFEIKFRPIELIIIIDNLISNSEKADAKKISFKWQKVSQNEMKLFVTDNGKGIKDEIINDIFEFRFSTTNGSGLGLYHTFDIIQRMKGEISVNNKLKKGVEFIITFKK
ncbi:MAG: ATP-binding protein [Bacteroidales bacterium]|nr:ATP-binding protein [Bacteroidales bacterium]